MSRTGHFGNGRRWVFIRSSSKNQSSGRSEVLLTPPLRQRTARGWGTHRANASVCPGHPSHIGFVIRPNYTGDPHAQDIQDYWNGLQFCLKLYRYKRCNGPNDPQPECQRVPEADPKAVQQLINMGKLFTAIVAGGAVASQPELWPALPALAPALSH